MKSNSLVQLLYAAEAAGYATAASYESSAEWDAATLRRRRQGTRVASALALASSTVIGALRAVFYSIV